MGVYERLWELAAQHAAAGYLRHFGADLTVHDKRSLAAAKAGDRFVWILRSCGTQLHPVGVGMDSAWATYWLDAGNDRACPVLCWSVSVTADGGAAGLVMPLQYDAVRRLAAIPHPEGRRLVVSLCGPSREVDARGESLPAYFRPDAFLRGQAVWYGEFPATVIDHYSEGMWNIRVPGGTTCVSGAHLKRREG